MSMFRKLIVLTILSFTTFGDAFAELLHCKHNNGNVGNKYRLEGKLIFHVFTEVEREARVYEWSKEHVFFDDRSLYIDTIFTYLSDNPIGNETIGCGCKSEALKTATAINRFDLTLTKVALNDVSGEPIFDYYAPYREKGIDRLPGPAERDLGTQLCNKIHKGTCQIQKGDKVTGLLRDYTQKCRIFSKQF